MNTDRIAIFMIDLFLICFLSMVIYLGLDGIDFHARERSIISRQKSDLRTTQKALDQYYSDHQEYPPMIPLKPEDQTHQPEHLQTIQFNILTTPVNYLPGAKGFIQSRYPTGYYIRTKPNFLPIRKGYLVYQEGIDGDFDIQDPEQILTTSNKEEAVTRLAPFTYDPTNGTRSSGDVWWIHYE